MSLDLARTVADAAGVGATKVAIEKLQEVLS